MPVGLLGRKIGMTQIFDDQGEIVPVTVIEAGPCVVTQVRTLDRDGYEAVQLGFADKPRRLASRRERGHVAEIAGKRQKARQAAGLESGGRAGCEPQRFYKEFRTDGQSHGLEVGQVLKVEHLEGVARVDVAGTSKGHGTTGVMKRHNFQGQGAAHGTKKVHRRAGGIGAAADPARIFPGRKMAGQHGNASRTVRHLEVVRIDADKDVLLVRGAVPGPTGGYVTIRRTSKNRYRNSSN